jgi:protein involved in polysaccharide export with SLBB domain
LKKQILLTFHLIYIVPCLFFSSGVFSQESSYDKDFLESLPDDVRDDVENELKISSKENKTKISKRPSSRLSKLDTVKKWERFLSEEYALNNGTERYGLSIFRTMQTSFMPINEPNFDSNYIVDFGDSFNIKVTGTKNTEYSADVQRDGSLFIENVGNVFISGLDISQAIATIKNKFNSTIIGEDIFINLSEVRDIQVLITGDSFAPGIYTLNGNTNILHALSMSGGIKEAGSLRSLDIKRNGKKIKEYDVYNAILKGEINFNQKLQSGDSIIINSVQNLVRVSGGIKRPGLYELKKDETLFDLISFANGYSSSKSDKKLEYTYSLGADVITKKISVEDLKSITPIDGASLYIPFHKKNYVEVSGEVKNPGIYPISDSDSISTIIKRAGGYKKNSYPFAGILYNKSAKRIEKDSAKKSYDYFIKSLTNMTLSPSDTSSSGSIIEIASLLSEYIDSEFLGRIQANFDLLDIQNNPNKDTLLSDGDRIVIPKLTDQVYVFGEVAQGGAKRYDDSLDYKDYILSKSGGFTKFADKSGIYIIRPDGSSEQLNQNNFISLGIMRDDLAIYPGSIIYVAPKTVTNLQNVSMIAPIVSSLVLTVASLQSIK